MKYRYEQDLWSGGYRIIITSNKGVTRMGMIINKRIGNKVGHYKQYNERIVFNQEMYKNLKILRTCKVICTFETKERPKCSYLLLPCHLFKLYERLILQGGDTNQSGLNLVLQQASFRSGRFCIAQILNLTEHNEAGFENEQITSIV